MLVPESALPLYQLCWQLENWLRTIVYVELRADRSDWDEPLKVMFKKGPLQALENDKALHHMATPHKATLSYITFGQLVQLITSDNLWCLFNCYFPPKANTIARLDEVKAIRNRIAHFREPHINDLDRLTLFMKDMEPGVRTFCRRYTGGTYSRDNFNDPVSTILTERWEDIGYGIQLHGPNGWLFPPGTPRMRPRMNADIRMLFRKSNERSHPQGAIYRITVRSGNDRCDLIDVENIFNSTRPWHDDIIHMILSIDGSNLSFTIPAILGEEYVANIIIDILTAGVNAAGNCVRAEPQRNEFNWPEYVLWPDNILTLNYEEIRGNIFEFPDAIKPVRPE